MRRPEVTLLAIHESNLPILITIIDDHAGRTMCCVKAMQMLQQDFIYRHPRRVSPQPMLLALSGHCTTTNLFYDDSYFIVHRC